MDVARFSSRFRLRRRLGQGREAVVGVGAAALGDVGGPGPAPGCELPGGGNAGLGYRVDDVVELRRGPAVGPAGDAEPPVSGPGSFEGAEEVGDVGVPGGGVGAVVEEDGLGARRADLVGEPGVVAELGRAGGDLVEAYSLSPVPVLEAAGLGEDLLGLAAGVAGVDVAGDADSGSLEGSGGLPERRLRTASRPVRHVEDDHADLVGVVGQPLPLVRVDRRVEVGGHDQPWLRVRRQSGRRGHGAPSHRSRADAARSRCGLQLRSAAARVMSACCQSTQPDRAEPAPSSCTVTARPAAASSSRTRARAGLATPLPMFTSPCGSAVAVAALSTASATSRASTKSRTASSGPSLRLSPPPSRRSCAAAPPGSVSGGDPAPTTLNTRSTTASRPAVPARCTRRVPPRAVAPYRPAGRAGVSSVTGTCASPPPY